MTSNKPNEQNELNDKNSLNQKKKKNNSEEQNQKEVLDENIGIGMDDYIINNNETNKEFINDMDLQYDHPELMKKPLESTNTKTGTEENFNNKSIPFPIGKNNLNNCENQSKKDKCNNIFGQINNGINITSINLIKQNFNIDINKNEIEKYKNEFNKEGTNNISPLFYSNLLREPFEKKENYYVYKDERVTKEDFDKANMQSNQKDELENIEERTYYIPNDTSTNEQTNFANLINDNFAI